jgi:hypothetical protein
MHGRLGLSCSGDFFSYGNCEINSSLGDFNDYERYLYQLLE